MAVALTQIATPLGNLFAIRPGTLADYASLAHFHYRHGTPAAVSHVFVVVFDQARHAQQCGRYAWRGVEPEVVAIVVYTYPPAASSARDRATARRYVGWPDNRCGLLLLNREVRCVSRVIVDPRFRGLGLAAALLRATLPQLHVPLVETAAVMGGLVPLFERVGFKPVRVPSARTRSSRKPRQPTTPYFLWRYPETASR